MSPYIHNVLTRAKHLWIYVSMKIQFFPQTMKIDIHEFKWIHDISSILTWKYVNCVLYSSGIICSVVPMANNNSNLCKDLLRYPYNPKHQILNIASKSNSMVKATWNDNQNPCCNLKLDIFQIKWKTEKCDTFGTVKRSSHKIIEREAKCKTPNTLICTWSLTFLVSYRQFNKKCFPCVSKMLKCEIYIINQRIIKFQLNTT